jgi:hypothetical protein
LLVRIVLLFLIFMLALALFGKWRPRLPGMRRRSRLEAKPCPHCGAPRMGDGRCPCGKW